MQPIAQISVEEVAYYWVDTLPDVAAKVLANAGLKSSVQLPNPVPEISKGADTSVPVDRNFLATAAMTIETPTEEVTKTVGTKTEKPQVSVGVVEDISDRIKGLFTPLASSTKPEAAKDNDPMAA